MSTACRCLYDYFNYVERSNAQSILLNVISIFKDVLRLKHVFNFNVVIELETGHSKLSKIIVNTSVAI